VSGSDNVWPPTNTAKFGSFWAVAALWRRVKYVEQFERKIAQHMRISASYATVEGRVKVLHHYFGVLEQH